jgi:hypothetical protein
MRYGKSAIFRQNVRPTSRPMAFTRRTKCSASCLLVLISATPEGKKELVGFTDGARESANG